jgi:aspartate oxidase
MIVYASDKTRQRGVSHWPEEEIVEAEGGHTHPRVSVDKTSHGECIIEALTSDLEHMMICMCHW